MSDPTWLQEAVATRDLDRVGASMPAAGERINDTRRHVDSARRPATADPTLAEDLEDADEIRRDRALAEYGDFAARGLSESHIRSAADVAERIVNAVATELAGRRQRP